MSEVLIRNLDEEVVEQLKARAHGNGRSLQGELKRILEQAARPGPERPSRAEYRELADRFRAALGDRPRATAPRCWPRTGLDTPIASAAHRRASVGIIRSGFPARPGPIRVRLI